MLIVKKFGGTSVADANCIKNVAKIIKKDYLAGNKVAVVVSAMGKTTNEFITLSKQINPNPSKREYDVLLSAGEQISISLLAMALEKIGVKAISFTGWQIGFLTCGAHSKAKIKSIDKNKIIKKLNENHVIIIAGFQGVTEFGDITTLGRGGSDTSAVALAVALKADLCEIYTDVDGIYTIDPRIIKNARKLKKISYTEMLELASLGASVLHSRAVEIARNNKIKLCVRSSFNIDTEGTFVVNENELNTLERKVIITGIAIDNNVFSVSLIKVEDKPGVASEIFTELAKQNINVDMIVQSSNKSYYKDITFTVESNDFKDTIQAIENIKSKLKFENISYSKEVSKLSIVGAGIKTNPGVAAKMFEILAANNVNIEMISTSEIRISTVVSENIKDKVVNELYDVFNLDRGDN